MGDLGALQFVQNFDMLRWDDNDVANVIRHSNVVYNLIGNYKEMSLKCLLNLKLWRPT